MMDLSDIIDLTCDALEHETKDTCGHCIRTIVTQAVADAYALGSYVVADASEEINKEEHVELSCNKRGLELAN